MRRHIVVCDFPRRNSHGTFAHKPRTGSPVPSTCLETTAISLWIAGSNAVPLAAPRPIRPDAHHRSLRDNRETRSPVDVAPAGHRFGGPMRNNPDWLVMLYLAGGNNLSSEMIRALKEIEDQGLPRGFEMTILYDA